jgi:gliding motility-associated-like protein
MVANTSAVDTIISYILTATSGNCSDKDTVQVTIKPTQIASITVNDAIQCFNAQDFDFNIGSALVPGAVFNWNFGPNATPASSNISNPANITYSSTGTFTVYLSASANGCPVTSDSLPITVSPIPVPSISADVVQGCSPLTVQFMDSTNMSQPGFTFNWNFGTAGTATGPAPLITFSQGGVYDVSLTVTSAAGCDSAIMIPAMITVLQTPQASLTATPTVTTIVDPTIVFNNLSSSFDSCLIQYGDGTFSDNCEGPHAYADTGTYLVTLYLYNGNGCTDSIQLTVYVKPFFTFYAPNAFTPNGDGKNDFFLTYSEGVKEFSLIIYGRNGVPVFKADNIYEAWYGKYNDTSDPVQDGVYVYRAAVTDVFNKKHVYYGRVSVIR